MIMRGRGRPKMSEDTKHKSRFPVRLTEYENGMLEELASYENMSKSDYIRQLIKEAYERHENIRGYTYYADNESYYSEDESPWN